MTNLTGKRAVIFGAGGSIGSVVAKEFAVQGAEGFLSGRTKTDVENVAKQILGAGGRAQAEVVDALDETAVNAYIDRIAESGNIDIVFNATGPRIAEYGNGKPAIALSTAEFMRPVGAVLKSNFITAQAAARRMLQQRTGVIIFLTGSPARPHIPGASGIGAAFAGIENLMRHLAIELSPSGVRVVGLRASAMPETRTIQDTMEAVAHFAGITKEQAVASLANNTMLRVSPSTSDIARVAAFLASDDARMITGAVVNSSAGAVWD